MPETQKREKRFGARELIETFLLLVTVIGVFFGIKTWQESTIDKTIDRKLNDEFYLRKIAAKSRPALVFNANESIVSDSGAAQYVKDIQINFTTNETTWGGVTSPIPRSVHIEFNSHLASPPILTPMSDSMTVNAERGKGLSWDFELEWIVAPWSTNNTKRFYRLEFFP